MPKTKPPKLCKSGNQAFVLVDRKKHYLPGRWGSPETEAAYARFQLEWWENHRNPANAAKSALLQQGRENSDATVEQLAGLYLAYAEARLRSDFSNVKTIIMDFLLPLFGGEYPVESFTPKCLKMVRSAMVQSGRFSRKTINKHTSRIATIFRWGVSEELVQETTHRALLTVQQLEPGHPGTFDHPDREDVPFDVVNLALSVMVPTLQAMVQIQGLHGMRPEEICSMRVNEVTVGDARRGQDPNLWYYTPAHHKTLKITGKKTVFALAKYEQDLIAPYLIGKNPDNAVFSPAQAMRERNAERRANRKSKQTPSQKERDKARAKKPRRYNEFYTPNSYRKAVKYAIAKVNKRLPENMRSPHWYPYKLRHAAITVTSLEHGKDAAQALAGHTSSRMTDNYDHSQLRKREELARNRRNPFAKPPIEVQ